MNKLLLSKAPFRLRHFSSAISKKTMAPIQIKPADRVSHFSRDVWSIFTPLALESKAINLGQGYMNFGPPAIVQDAAKEALNTVEANQYSHPRGRLRLRNTLAASYSKEFNRQLDPETEILVTAGANEGMFSVFAAFLDQGDEVICMEPFFDQYIPNITMNGGKPVYVPLRPPADSDQRVISSHEWRLDINELKSKVTPRTKMIVINTPHNPIGKVFDHEELSAIGQVAKDHNLIILSDEVYDRLYYPPLNQFPRIANVDGLWDRTITVGSGGKSFAATGWRVGWLIGPNSLIQHAFAAQTRVVFCVNSPCQEAVAAGFEASLTTPIFQNQIEAYLKKRTMLAKVFDELGLPYTMPEGAYYILVNTQKIKYPVDYKFPEILNDRGDDFKMCYWLTKEIGVCAIPPSEFYEKEHWSLAKDFARFAFCKTDDVLLEAVKRLKALKTYIH
ncbi:pyridoxal phosphate-dependent transferase [Cokeromyces recurvatus]|uniref:pyridoxal phosphate-dependent transferase n=1 Tax=Cokeromyces recurvatus TaxID=90255 RepID=UPI002220BC09|nr:pyridoxal phosphate-dependent transferase [Cokeromyces recurvatus]KAI7906266.1 pyridoxal phosphate-dependent transferase [Cokeromyces recurvatus]